MTAPSAYLPDKEKIATAITFGLLACEQSSVMNVPCIKTSAGETLTDSGPITDCLAAFYSELYTSKVAYTKDDLDTYLTSVDFPEYRAYIDSPINLKEVQTAIFSLQTWKTQRSDGFPVEFFKSYIEKLAPRLHSMLVHS